jgi:hypothetical protein
MRHVFFLIFSLLSLVGCHINYHQVTPSGHGTWFLATSRGVFECDYDKQTRCFELLQVVTPQFKKPVETEVPVLKPEKRGR